MIGEKKKIGVGMIGYKFMGKAHSNGYRQLPFFFDTDAEPVLKTIVGRNPSEVAAASRKMGWQSYETDWRKLLERDDIDLIDIVTPNDSHAEMAIAALQAGKHVVCEKPLALTMEQAKQMKAAADQADKVTMILHNYRFAPAVQFAKQLIDRGRLGKIRHMRAVYLNEGLLDPNRPYRWRLSKQYAGSGALGDIGSHILDLARFLVGEFRQVIGMMETFVGERKIEGSSEMGIVDVDDTTAVLAKFENGAVGTFEASRYAGGNKNGNRFEINGEKGSIRWDLENMNHLQVYLADDEDGLKGFKTIICTDPVHPLAKNYWPPGHIIGYEHTFIGILHDLIQGIAHNTRPTPDFTDGLKNMAVLTAIEESVERGTWVNISEILES